MLTDLGFNVFELQPLKDHFEIKHFQKSQWKYWLSEFLK